ncbi:hypothetical protein D3C86_1848340 [compost metagenome]
MLDFAGYLKPEEQVIAGVTMKIMMDQPDAVLLCLKLIVTVIPFALLFITFNMARKYPLTQYVQEKLNHYLEFKRGNIKESPLSENEVEEMKRTLIGVRTDN